jgi:hypothetical protein
LGLVCIIPHGILSEPVTDAAPLEYILAVINSRVQSFYFATYVIDYSLGGGLVHATPGAQGQLLVPKASRSQVSDVVTLTREMLALQGRGTRTAEAVRTIAALDRRIDEAVYGLFGLGGEDIAVVEGMQ